MPWSGWHAPAEAAGSGGWSASIPGVVGCNPQDMGPEGGRLLDRQLLGAHRQPAAPDLDPGPGVGGEPRRGRLLRHGLAAKTTFAGVSLLWFATTTVASLRIRQGRVSSTASG
jgi:hypothetical protein